MATSVGACQERVLSKARGIMRAVEGIVRGCSESKVSTKQARMALALHLDALQVCHAASTLSRTTSLTCLQMLAMDLTCKQGMYQKCCLITGMQSYPVSIESRVIGHSPCV